MFRRRRIPQLPGQLVTVLDSAPDDAVWLKVSPIASATRGHVGLQPEQWIDANRKIIHRHRPQRLVGTIDARDLPEIGEPHPSTTSIIYVPVPGRASS